MKKILNIVFENKMGIFALPMFVVLLQACGGGGGGSSNNTPVAQSSMAANISSTAASQQASSSSAIQTALKKSLDSIVERLDKNPPSLIGSNFPRTDPIAELDVILWDTDETKETPVEIRDYYAERVKKVAIEIEEPVTQGLRIWNLYNHGFIVKTPTSVFAFDLVQGKIDWTTEVPISILSKIDVLFVSHEHGDHYDNTEKIPSYVKNHGGQVLYPKYAIGKGNTTMIMEHNDSVVIKDLHITAYETTHNAPNMAYMVKTAEGYKILHTGDTQEPQSLPAESNIHVLLLNGWINENNEANLIGMGMKSSLAKIKPHLMIPGHFQELSHHKRDGTGRYKYLPALELQNDETQKSKTIVLTWGEKIDYTEPVCQSPLIKVYNECQMPEPVAERICFEPAAMVDNVCTAPALLTPLIVQGNLSWTPFGDRKVYLDAYDYCRLTAIDGKTGWRLPTIDDFTQLNTAGITLTTTTGELSSGTLLWTSSNRYYSDEGRINVKEAWVRLLGSSVPDPGPNFFGMGTAEWAEVSYSCVREN